MTTTFPLPRRVELLPQPTAREKQGNPEGPVPPPPPITAELGEKHDRPGRRRFARVTMSKRLSTMKVLEKTSHVTEQKRTENVGFRASFSNFPWTAFLFKCSSFHMLRSVIRWKVLDKHH